MKTEIIIDASAVAELMKDKDIACKIKSTVIETVAKQAIETMKDEMTERIRKDIDNMIAATLHADTGAMFYPNRDERIVKLACMARDEITKEVNRAFMRQVENEVYSQIRKQTDRLRKRVDEIMKTVTKKRLVDNVKWAAADIVETAIRKGFGCKV